MASGTAAAAADGVAWSEGSGYPGDIMRGGRWASSDVATEIFLWLTRIPRCAIKALSTLRTVCFGVTSSVVSKCISSTAPLLPAIMRAEITPGSVARRSSAR
jgi:hypothetical protein